MNYSDLTFKTPCGLFVKKTFDIFDYTAENGNPVCVCPYFTRTEICKLNNKYVEEVIDFGCHYEKLHGCMVKITNEPYDYEKSVEKLIKNEKEIEDKITDEFRKKKNGRVCNQFMRYNRHTREIEQNYFPEICIGMNCNYCSIYQVNLAGKKCNIFYDLKIDYIETGVGLIPDTRKQKIVKNIKLTRETVSKTLADIVCKSGKLKNYIQDLEESRQKRNAKYNGEQIISVEVFNLHTEIKKKHDIYEDLQAIKDGIDVSYADVLLKQKAQEKSERAAEARQKKIDKIKKLYIENGYDGLGKEERKFMKFVDSGMIDWEELDELHEQYLEKQKEKKQNEQLSFF